MDWWWRQRARVRELAVNFDARTCSIAVTGAVKDNFSTEIKAFHSLADAINLYFPRLSLEIKVPQSKKDTTCISLHENFDSKCENFDTNYQTVDILLAGRFV